MISSIANSIQNVKPILDNLPDAQKIDAPSEKSDSDLIEISDRAAQYDLYMQAIGKLPEVRQDVVEYGRELTQDERYPPLQVTLGISTLFGGVLSRKLIDI